MATGPTSPLTTAGQTPLSFDDARLVLKGALPNPAPGRVTEAEQDEELRVLLLAGRDIVDRWFAEEADVNAPDGQFPRAWSNFSQSQFDNLRVEVGQKLEAYVERRQVGQIADRLKDPPRSAGRRAVSFIGREALAGIIGAIGVVIFIVVASWTVGALGGREFVRDLFDAIVPPAEARRTDRS